MSSMAEAVVVLPTFAFKSTVLLTSKASELEAGLQ